MRLLTSDVFHGWILCLGAQGILGRAWHKRAWRMAKVDASSWSRPVIAGGRRMQMSRSPRRPTTDVLTVLGERRRRGGSPERLHMLGSHRWCLLECGGGLDSHCRVGGRETRRGRWSRRGGLDPDQQRLGARVDRHVPPASAILPLSTTTTSPTPLAFLPVAVGTALRRLSLGLRGAIFSAGTSAPLWQSSNSSPASSDKALFHGLAIPSLRRLPRDLRLPRSYR